MTTTPADLRQQTCQRFDQWGLVFNEHLPLLEPAENLRPKRAGEAAGRALAARHLAAVALGRPAGPAREVLRRWDIEHFLTGDEQDFLADPKPAPMRTAYNSWVVESIQFMAWSMGKAGLEPFLPISPDLPLVFPAAEEDPRPFLRDAKLRPFEEIWQEADTLYMLHWLAVEQSLGGQQDERVVLPRIAFRRHAADWVIGVADAWEDVQLDT